jgi:hypothetical protein
MNNYFANILKYLIEGIVVAVVAYYLTGRKRNVTEVASIGVVAALTFAVLDFFTPSIGSSARLGSGFGIGSNLVGFAGQGLNPNELLRMPTMGGEAGSDVVDDEDAVFEEDDEAQMMNANDNFGE